MFGQWDGLMMVLGITFMIIYGIVFLFRRIEKRIKDAPVVTHCTHENEQNHDRIACLQRQQLGVFGAIEVFLVLGLFMR